MMSHKYLLFLAFVEIVFETTFAQHSPYSLQAAVNALHRRESQLALQEDNYATPQRFLAPNDEFYREESDVPQVNRRQLNKLLAKYLIREDEEERAENDGGYTDVLKKRSFFRERDGSVGGGDDESVTPSVFREREIGAHASETELAEEFLREIEKEKELEREEKYQENLRRLWEKYQQQENEIEEELFDEGQKDRQYPAIKNAGSYIGPLMEKKKRNFPVLPWLPASRKKRFPIAKRSPKPLNVRVSGKQETGGTNEKVVHDLQAIFGNDSHDKKKTFLTEEEHLSVAKEHSTVKKNEKRSAHHMDGGYGHPEHHGESNQNPQHQHQHHPGHHGESGDKHEEGESVEHDENEDEHDLEDEVVQDRKKKREAEAKAATGTSAATKRSAPEIIKEDQIIPGDLNKFRNKKSINWSKYFGLDRKKKAQGWVLHGNIMKKLSSSIENNDDEDKRKKKNLDPEKLDSMNDKLKNIEDVIIDETVKYTGAHEGINDPEEILRFKDHVVSRLATAYSLEKMRRALSKLRKSVDNENHLEKNEIEEFTSSAEKKDSTTASNEKEKRIAVKKEKVEFDNNENKVASSSVGSEKSQEIQLNNLDDTPDDSKKKDEKRNYSPSLLGSELGDFEEELGAGHFEPLEDPNSEAYGNEYRQCPILDSIEERCRGVDLLSGDIHQNLLPACGVHQLCYICGTTQAVCDFQYLAEADAACGHHNRECHSIARNALMVLRGMPGGGPQLGPTECLSNPCLNRALREIEL